ncbi:MAG TPA: hypothetical protein VE860_02430 [Chthoniobacterales bacterium]|jgi:hypothetical protein|nr:hypothetical protein [Chthoniobacterales bacterium]
MPDSNPQPDPNPQNIDVAKLYESYKNAEQHDQIGCRVLRAVIIDVLRSKSSGTAPTYFLRWFGPESRVAAVLHELIHKVSLTEEERRILDEVEKEE